MCNIKLHQITVHEDGVDDIPEQAVLHGVAVDLAQQALYTALSVQTKPKHCT